MLYLDRKLDLGPLIAKKSLFLFGPRQTGKSSLVRHTLQDAVIYNLNNTDLYRLFSAQPSRMRQQLAATQTRLVVIDEIQKIPELLNEVQLLIDEQQFRFLLTGSSARKLRKGAANLLGGRARSRRLHPLIYSELGARFDLSRAINFGLIPSIYFSDTPKEELRSYVGDYLREEIAAEGLTRNIPAFSRFLDVAAMSHGQIINYSNIASDTEIGRTTIQNYFEILKDTLVGSELPAWQKSKKRKPITKSKFYFFDQGVVNTLQNSGEILPRSPLFGQAFESFVFHELSSFNDYVIQSNLCYWRSEHDDEVDFIIDDSVAIEVKAKDVVSDRDLKGIMRLKDENKLKHYLVVSFEDTPRIVNGVNILPWQDFLKALWQREWI
jgi:predicted AAA+ superfamily ATPase